MVQRALVVTAILCCGLSAAASATILHVPSQYGTIQAGINAAAAGDTVLVAPGTYSGAGNRDLDFGGVDMVVMSDSGAAATIIDCGGTAAAWHRGFWFHNGESVAAVVQGFTIKNGYYDLGGGILAAPDTSYPFMTGSNPTIVGNIITGDTATSQGGGIASLDQCSPTIDGNTITGNLSMDRGGGIHVRGTSYIPPSTPTIVGNIITDNEAEDGGGISCGGNLPGGPFAWATVARNTISSNVANWRGGGIFCVSVNAGPEIDGNAVSGNTAQYGGGICCHAGSYPPIKNNTVTENEGINDGGGILCQGDSSPTIVDNTITWNLTAGDGAGICCYESSPTIRRNAIAYNALFSPCACGGGIFGAVSSPVVDNNTIWENAAHDGGGIYWINDCFPTVDMTTINANTALNTGGGIACYWGASPTVTNSILWDDTAPLGPEIHLDATSVIAVTYSDVQGGWIGTGNINANPVFVAGLHGSHYLSHTAAGQPVQSPCVDAGDPMAAVPTSTTRTDEVQDSGVLDMGRHYSRPSLLHIRVTPDGSHFDPGTDLWFTVELVNVTDTTLSFDAWVDAFLPNGNPYNQNPVIGPVHPTFGSGSGPHNLRRSIHIPSGAPLGGPYELRVRAGVHPGAVWEEDGFYFWLGPEFLIWEPDPTPISGQAIKDALDDNGRTWEFVTGSLGSYNLSRYEALFVCVGMFSNNYQILAGSAEAGQIEAYIADGGNVYLEGGDIWYYDPLFAGGHDFGPSFGISALADGGADLFNVSGVANTLMPGLSALSSAYTGENSWVDELAAIAPAQIVFTNADNTDDIGVAKSTVSGGHTIGTSFEIGGTAYSTFVEPAVAEFIEFFEGAED